MSSSIAISSFPRIPTIYTDLSAPSRRSANVPFIRTLVPSSSSSPSPLPRPSRSNMVRPSRSITLPLRPVASRAAPTISFSPVPTQSKRTTPATLSYSSAVTNENGSLVKTHRATEDALQLIIAQEQRDARARAVAVLLLNRACTTGRRRRSYFGQNQRQYVRSGLSFCVLPEVEVEA